jgi:hypothetical protein
MSGFSFCPICALVLCAAACGSVGSDASHGGPGGSPGGIDGGPKVRDTNLGSLVFGVGLPPDELYLFAASFHGVLRAGGAVALDQTIGNGTPASVPLPMELPVKDMPAGTEVEASIDVDPGKDGSRWRQLARSRIEAGKTLLQRIPIAPIGPFSECYPACPQGLTCAWNRCRDPYVAPEHLEEYTPDWAKYSYCQPKAHGAPVVILGTGDQDFTPLDDGAVADLWAGNQGGHHVYVALRMRNLRQQAIMRLDGYVEELGITIPPVLQVVVFRDDAAAGYCERVGIIFQLDQEVEIQQVFGRTLQMTVRVTDADGTTAEDKKTVVLSSDTQPL